MRVVPNTATMSVLYFCGYCGAVTAHGVCVAASTVGATMPRMLRPGQPLTGSQSFCSVRAATQVAVLQPSRTSLQPRRNSASTPLRVSATISSGGAVAVGHVGVVAEIDEGDVRKALDERAERR